MPFNVRSHRDRSGGSLMCGLYGSAAGSLRSRELGYVQRSQCWLCGPHPEGGEGKEATEMNNSTCHQVTFPISRNQLPIVGSFESFSFISMTFLLFLLLPDSYHIFVMLHASECCKNQRHCLPQNSLEVRAGRKKRWSHAYTQQRRPMAENKTRLLDHLLGC